MKSFLRILLLVAVISLPVMVFGQAEDLDAAYVTIKNIISNIVIPLIIAIAGLYFMWGVVQYVTAGDSEEKRDSGRSMMVYGIVALFVMISVWGLVNLLADTFGLGNALDPGKIPEVPTR